jgi:hypothetical protein
MEDLAVYGALSGLSYHLTLRPRLGYITPTRVKIIIALALADYVVRDTDVVNVRPYHFIRPLPSNPSADLQNPTHRLRSIPQQSFPSSLYGPTNRPYSTRTDQPEREERSREASRRDRSCDWYDCGCD